MGVASTVAAAPTAAALTPRTVEQIDKFGADVAKTVLARTSENGALIVNFSASTQQRATAHHAHNAPVSPFSP